MLEQMVLGYKPANQFWRIPAFTLSHKIGYEERKFRTKELLVPVNIIDTSFVFNW